MIYDKDTKLGIGHTTEVGCVSLYSIHSVCKVSRFVSKQQSKSPVRGGTLFFVFSQNLSKQITKLKFKYVIIYKLKQPTPVV